MAQKYSTTLPIQGPWTEDVMCTRKWQTSFGASSIQELGRSHYGIWFQDHQNISKTIFRLRETHAFELWPNALSEKRELGFICLLKCTANVQQVDHPMYHILVEPEQCCQLSFSVSWWLSCLVGGLNPFEKYEGQLGWSFPIYGKIIQSCPSQHQPAVLWEIEDFPHGFIGMGGRHHGTPTGTLAARAITDGTAAASEVVDIDDEGPMDCLSCLDGGWWWYHLLSWSIHVLSTFSG